MQLLNDRSLAVCYRLRGQERAQVYLSKVSVKENIMTLISALCLLSSTLVALSLFVVGASAFTMDKASPKVTVTVPQPKVGKNTATAVHPPKVPAVQGTSGNTPGKQQ